MPGTPIDILICVSRKQLRGYYADQAAYAIVCKTGEHIHQHWDCMEISAGDAMVAKALIRICNAYAHNDSNGRFNFYTSYSTNIKQNIDFVQASIERLDTTKSPKPTKKTDPELWIELYHSISFLDYGLSEIQNYPDKAVASVAKKLSALKAEAFKKRNDNEPQSWMDNNNFDWLKSE